MNSISASRTIFSDDGDVVDDVVAVVVEEVVDVVACVVVPIGGMVEHLIQCDVSSSDLQKRHFGRLHALQPRPPCGSSGVQHLASYVPQPSQ